MKKILNSDGIKDLLSSCVAVFIGLIFGLIVILIANSDYAVEGFLTLISGGFSNGARGIGQVINQAVPIILTGLSVGFAFKTGLFNIGTPGQFVVGAFVAIYVGVEWTFLPGALHWIVAIILAGIAGSLWGAVPGLMKAYLNVNEVISSIIMNYIGMYTVNYIIPLTVFDSMKNQTLNVNQNAIISKFGLDLLVPNINGGIVVAILAVVVIHIILNKTTFGFELKACGFSPDASKYAGINAKQKIVFSMMIAGALAGIGGGLLYLAGSGQCLQVVDTLAPEGFNGIAVALLGLSNPFGVLIAGLFIAHITIGGSLMQIYGFIPQIVDIIVAITIYFSAFSLLIKQFLNKHKLFNADNIKKEEQSHG
ncbi:ABC transporter permease [Candidatus Stoquefichus massiliensis]|uniref:ABC transporter permease n=1 Tax=Candidatus Stoquefichus massiliensis TaxID=1470350 RepID=UPI000486A378|nr:ABC transporter permease [Candidatus Stoquefichus massiliensis]